MKTKTLFFMSTLLFFVGCAKIENQQDCRKNILSVLNMIPCQDTEMIDNKDYLFEHTLNGQNFYYVKNVMDCEIAYYAPIDCLGRTLCQQGDNSCYENYNAKGRELGIVGKEQ